MYSTVAIYVLPTEEGLPPRAIVGEPTDEGIEGNVATWNADTGAWTIAGIPVPEELGDAITEHAKSLGVEW